MKNKEAPRCECIEQMFWNLFLIVPIIFGLVNTYMTMFVNFLPDFSLNENHTQI